MSTTTHTTPAGITVPVLTREETRASRGDSAPGLGTFAVTFYGAIPIWYYLSPQHGACHASHPERSDRAEPPPLPRPNPVRCGCSAREHRCGSCGQPYWVEIHGMADGYCTYCYARG
jgi:hypothetical protein